MPFPRHVLTLAACLYIVSSPARACDVHLATESIESISRQLSARQVERIEVLRIPDLVFTRIPISPNDFEHYPHKKYTLRLDEGDTVELAAPLRKLELTQLVDPPDLRWEVIFLDGAGRRIHSIFLAKMYWYGKGRKGYVDGNICGFGRSLIKLLEQRTRSLD
jgi:hypothetical protein